MSQRAVTKSRNEAFARVVWSAHILSYLSQQRSQPAVIPSVTIAKADTEAEAEEEEEEEEEDFPSNVTTALGSVDEDIKAKFLDCIAETLSSKKGWHYVTATGLREYECDVIVDVARNTDFSVVEADQHYLTLLKNFLFAQGKGKHADTGRLDFEEATITYHSARLNSSSSRLHDLIRMKFERIFEAEEYQLSGASSLVRVLRFLQATEVNLISLVRSSYECTQSPDVKIFLDSILGLTASNKVWREICLLARPVSACRLLEDVARCLPQFQRIEVILHKSPDPVILDGQFTLSIHEAWQRLGLPEQTAATRRVLQQFKDVFKKDCSKPFSTHAEVQLMIHYSNSLHTEPTLAYLGCSKKSCLLCEILMRKSPLQLKTRGRHGKCYPAWGIPLSNIENLEVQLAQVAESLFDRILECQNNAGGFFYQPAAESSVLSGLKDSDVGKLMLRKHTINEEEQRRNAIHGRLQLQPVDEPRGCIMCDSKPGLLCTRCQSCRYCSKECQAADWSSHRLLCKKYAERSSPPSESHRLAIEFPQEKRNPRLIWVLCEKKFDDGPRERAFVSAFLGKDNPNSGHRLVRRNPRRDRDLINTIEVVFRDTFLIDGSKPNRSLYNAVGSTSHDWRGPSVVLRKKGLSRDPNFYADISLADYRHVLDYFATYGDDNVSVLEQGINPPTRSYNAVLGVKVTCFGEQKLHSAKPFVQVLVPVTHVERNNLYPEGEISPISRLVGLPIRAWKFTTKGEWQNRADWEFNMHPDSNLTASKLFMEPEICSPGWGWAPMCWQTGIGNVLLLRADDTDLLVEDAELLCRFCEWKLQPLFEDALGGGRTHRSKQEVVDFITMDNMGKFRTELATRLKNDGA